MRRFIYLHYKLFAIGANLLCHRCWKIMLTNCLLVDNSNAALSLANSLTPGCDLYIDKVMGRDWPGPG